MARFILFVVLAYIFYHLLKFFFKETTPRKRNPEARLEPEELVQDPYCQKYIPKRLAIRNRIQGRDFYFCDRDCMDSYLRREKGNPPRENDARA